MDAPQSVIMDIVVIYMPIVIDKIIVLPILMMKCVIQGNIVQMVSLVAIIHRFANEVYENVL